MPSDNSPTALDMKNDTGHVLIETQSGMRIPDLLTIVSGYILRAVPRESASVQDTDFHKGGMCRPVSQGLSAAVLVAAIFIAVAGSAALSMDVPRDAFGVKGDEATYVAMALSVAYDRDFRFERRDLERFWSLYNTGPEGIFLKRGPRLHIRIAGKWPFIRSRPSAPQEAAQLYFAKAFLYGVAAAPFAALAGLNGLVFFNVLQLAAVFLLGYVFLAARAPSASALLMASAFLGASIVPLYAVWLSPEVLNFSLVFFAYFLWLYKETAPSEAGRSSRFLCGFGSDVCAAVLLGLATYSKPPNLLLILPVVALLWWRRRFRAGLLVGVVCLSVIAGGFGLTAGVTGEPNYQGGDRKTFYGAFPFDDANATFDNRGLSMSTNEVGLDESLERAVFWPRLRANVGYFVIGRHFGFVPYYFPGALIVTLAFCRWRSLRFWQVLPLAMVAVTAAWLIINLPFSWSGGGGPSGNRYFLSVYPVLFFVMPPFRSLIPGLAAWVGGAVFVSHILLNPLVAAKNPWLTSQGGLLRWLPVELTMINDLPVQLNLSRARLSDPGDPDVLLYLIDAKTFSPDAMGIWVAGRTRGEIVVRAGTPGGYLRVTLHSPVRNTVTLTAGGGARRASLEPGSTVEVQVPASWVQASGSLACLLSVSTEEGFVPHLLNPESPDNRFLGVQVRSIVATRALLGLPGDGR